MKGSISYCMGTPKPIRERGEFVVVAAEDRQNAGHVIAGSRSGGEEGLDAGAQAFRVADVGVDHLVERRAGFFGVGTIGFSVVIEQPLNGNGVEVSGGDILFPASCIPHWRISLWVVVSFANAGNL